MTSALPSRVTPGRTLGLLWLLGLFALTPGLAARPPQDPPQTADGPRQVEISLSGAERLHGELIVYLGRAGEKRAKLWQRLRLPETRSVVFEGLDQVLFLAGHELEVGVASRGAERCAARFRLGEDDPPRLELSGLVPLEVRVRGTAALGALDHLGIAEEGLTPWTNRGHQPVTGDRPGLFDIDVDRLFPSADGRSFRGFTHASAGQRRLDLWITGVADQDLPLAFAQFDQLALDSRLPPVELAALRGVHARILGRKERIAQVVCESLSNHERRIRLAAGDEDGLFSRRATIAWLVPEAQLHEPTRVVVRGFESDTSWSYICGDAVYDELRAELDLSLGADSVMGMDCGFGLPDGMGEPVFANVVTRAENGEVIDRKRIDLSGQQRHIEIPPLEGRRSLVFSNRAGSLVSPVYPVIADANYRVRLRPAHRLAIEFEGLEALRPFEPFLVLSGSATQSTALLLEIDRIRFPMRDLDSVEQDPGRLAALLGLPRHGHVELRGLVPGDLQVSLGWRGCGALVALPAAAFSVTNERLDIDLVELLRPVVRQTLVNDTRGFLAKDGLVAGELPASWTRRLAAARVPPSGALPVVATGLPFFSLDDGGYLLRHAALQGDESVEIEIGEVEVGAPVVLPLCPPDLQLEEFGAGAFQLRIRPALPAELAGDSRIFADWPALKIDFEGPEARIDLVEEGRYAVELVFESYLRVKKATSLARLDDVSPEELRAGIAAGWPWLALR